MSLEASSPEMDPERLDAFAEEFAARLRRGEEVSINEFKAREPSHAVEIEEFLRSIAAIERVREGIRDESNDALLQHHEASVPLQLGDYRILRELGRGGMGVVFEAIHVSLGRKVALKVLPSARLGNRKHRARFRREARAAARLHHANIVPVFGLGEAEGYHFYVMERVDGLPVNELIRQLRGREDDLANGSADKGPFTVSIATARTSTSTRYLVGTPATSGDQIESPAKTDPLSDDVRLPSEQATLAGGKSIQPNVSDQLNEKVDQVTPLSRFEQQAPVGDFDAASVSDVSVEVEAGPLLLPEPKSDEHFRWVAKIGQQLAAGLAYAHRQGVLHRDIKPGNVMLDRMGQALITDFGLAKQLEDPGVSQTGEVVGTPRYMAPEFLEGNAEPRSDVYCLGITLYEMLLLRPAYPEANTGQVLRKLLESDPPRMRSIDSRVPRDLETIIHKSMARYPSQRYGSADELADDLERYLQDRPIKARRTWWGEHLSRWARRNPAVASLTLTTFVLLAALLLVLGIGNWQLNLALDDVEVARRETAAELNEKESALKLANEENERAEVNLELALEAFEDVMNNISNRGIDPLLAIGDDTTDPELYGSSLTTADIQLLEQLLQFFDRFASENQKDFRPQAAEARRRVADIQNQLGRWAEAEATYDLALDAFRRLAIENPDEPEYMLQQARILIEQSKVASYRGRVMRAAELAQSASKLLTSNDQLSQRPDAKFELARTLSLYAAISTRSGLNYVMEWALPRRRRVPQTTVQRNRREGELVDRQGRISDSLERSVDLLQELINSESDQPNYHIALGRTRREQARLAHLNGQERLANVALRESIDEFNALLTKYPDSLSLKYELADSLSVELDDRRYTSARNQRASRLIDELLSVNASLPEFLTLKAIVEMNLGDDALNGGNFDEAKEYFESAGETIRGLSRSQRSTTRCQLLSIQSEVGLIEADRKAGNTKEAVTRLEENIATLERRLERGSRGQNPAAFRTILNRFRIWLRQIEQQK